MRVPTRGRLLTRPEILATRQGMWAAVASRKHSVAQIFAFGAGSLEFMLHGVVVYTAKTGQQSTKEWAARGQLAEDASGQLKFKSYQVYLVGGPCSLTRPLPPVRRSHPPRTRPRPPDEVPHSCAAKLARSGPIVSAASMQCQWPTPSSTSSEARFPLARQLVDRKTAR